MPQDTDWLSRLIGNGRGQYQADGINATLKRGVTRYMRDRSLMGFTLPLFADVGTGKTPSTLVYLHYVRQLLRERGDPNAEKPVLFIVPATVKWNWYAESNAWTDLGLIDILVIEGTPAEREKQLNYLKLLQPKITIINYELVNIHQQWFQSLGTETNPFFLSIVCDEAHYIKWASSQRARAVRSICAHFHCALTGTPMTNKPDSLHGVVEWLDNTSTYMRTLPYRPPLPKKQCPLPKWDKQRILNHSSGCGVCRFWDPVGTVCKQYATKKVKSKPFTDEREEERIRYRSSGRWGSLDTFKRTYCEMELQTWYERGGVERKAYKVIGPNKAMMSELHRRLLDFGMIRWRRAEVLKLEPIIYEHVALQPTPQQLDIYRQLREGYLAIYGDSGETLDVKGVHNALAQVTYFRRATTLTPREFQLGLQGRNPAFAPNLHIAVSDVGAKQEWLLEFIDSQLDQDGSNDKFLIFSDWTSCLIPLVTRVARRLKYDVLEYKGDQMVPQGVIKDPRGYVGIIRGGVGDIAKQALRDRWNSDPMFKVFIGSPAAFEGGNMQGGISADDTAYVIVLNMPWMPKDVVQAIGRAWRFGQDGQVVVLFPSLSGTIDERMATTLLGKQSSQDLGIDGGAQNMAQLFNPKSHREVLDLI